MTEPLAIIPEHGRQRMLYRLNPIITELRDLSRLTDEQLDDVIAGFLAALEDDGVIDDDEAKSILVGLFRAARQTAQGLNILDVLDESGPDAALRIVERGQAKRRTARKGGQGQTTAR